MLSAMVGCALIPVNDTGLAYYVAPDGDDNNPGAKAMPFATLEGAREAVRDLNRAGAIPEGGVTVRVRAGRYHLDQGFVLDGRDAGQPGSPVIYRNYPGETVNLIGGRTIPQQAFVPATEEQRAKVSDAARDHVLCVDLADLGIDTGEMPEKFRGAADVSELFFNDQPMQLARWPNQGWVTMGNVVDRGLPESKGGTGKLGQFEYAEDRQSSWDAENGVWLHGYWCHDWYDEIIRVKAIDPQQKRITLAAQHGYGLGASHSWNKVPRRYYALNILAELDSPGEWYVDRENSVLYFWPPKPMKEGTAVISTLSDPIVRLDDTSHVRWQGFVMEATRGAGAVVSGGNNNLIAGCTIRNTGRQAVSVSGQDNGVSGCDVYQTGTSGISVNGGDRASLQAGRNFAENNHIHHFARRQRTYAAAIHLQGVGNRARHNLIHNCPHAGILYGGNDNLIEANEIFLTCQETGDVGALYTGRDWGTQGNVIRRNFIHHTEGVNGWSMGVYLDDCDSGDTIEKNIFYRVRRAAFIGGGRYNRVVNNVFVDCRPAVHVDDRGRTRIKWDGDPQDSWNLKAKLERYNYREPPWSERYPYLTNILEDSPELPLHNTIAYNVCVGGTWLNARGDIPEMLDMHDNVITDQDPGFRNPDKLDFRFEKDAAIYDNLPQFEPIDQTAIGLYRDQWRASWPVRKPTLEGGLADPREDATKAASAAADLPVFTVPATTADIEVDGHLRAEEWRDAEAEGEMPIAENIGGQPATPPSVVYIMAGKKHLYVGASHKLPPNAAADTSSSWGTADAMEIAVRIPDDTGTVLAYRGYAGGHWEVSNEAGASDKAVDKARQGVDYAAQSSAERWTAEWRIPLEALAIGPGADTKKVLVNITVRKPAAGLWLMWQGTGGYSWQVEKAGWMQLP